MKPALQVLNISAHNRHTFFLCANLFLCLPAMFLRYNMPVYLVSKAIEKIFFFNLFTTHIYVSLFSCFMMKLLLFHFSVRWKNEGVLLSSSRSLLLECRCDLMKQFGMSL